MALQGTLETFSLPDVLRLLANTGKTGQLRLSGDRGTGSVWLSEGKIVRCEASGAPHAEEFVDVLFELLRFREGDFLFDTDGPTEAGEAVEVEPLLAEAEGLLAEWREIEAVVPSLRSWITLESELPGESVTLDAERWQVVTAVGHGSDVASLMDRLAKPELAVTRLVKDLVEAGLARVGEPPAGVPSGEPPVVTSRDTSQEVRPTVAAEAAMTGVGVADVHDTGEQPTAAEAGTGEAPIAEYEAVEMTATDDEVTTGLEEFERELAAEAEVAADEESAAVVGAEGAEVESEEQEEVSSADLLSMGSLDTADPEEAVEIARQLANLSPRAARAVAAAAKASTREERERALAAIDGMDDEINKELLLKFLSGGS